MSNRDSKSYLYVTIAQPLSLYLCLPCYLCRRNSWEGTMFRNCHPFLTAFPGRLWRVVASQSKCRECSCCMREQINSKQLVQNYIFDVLIVLNVDFCQWPAKIIHLKDNQQSTKFCSYSDSLSSIFLVICLWQSKLTLRPLLKRFVADKVSQDWEIHHKRKQQTNWR